MVYGFEWFATFEIIDKTTHLICSYLSVCALPRVVLLSMEMYFVSLTVSLRILTGTTKLGLLCRVDHPA